MRVLSYAPLPQSHHFLDQLIAMLHCRDDQRVVHGGRCIDDQVTWF
ncbi:MAG: hypothetical protein WBD31_32150 [Rubripirellula sp.]